MDPYPRLKATEESQSFPPMSEDEDYERHKPQVQSKQDNLHGEIKITDEHVKNNKEMRRVLAKNKIVPENLPPEEDIKKLERKIKKNEIQMARISKSKKK